MSVQTPVTTATATEVPRIEAPTVKTRGTPPLLPATILLLYYHCKEQQDRIDP